MYYDNNTSFTRAVCMLYGLDYILVPYMYMYVSLEPRPQRSPRAWVREYMSSYAHILCICLLQSKSLKPYAEYCANLVTAKQTLEAKKHEPAFQDFLQVRC